MIKKLYERKTGRCTCANCGVEFEKPQSEITRNEKLGRNNFCSRHCVGVFNTKNINNAEAYEIRKHAGNKRDDLTPFRYHYRNIKNRSYKMKVTVTLEDLKKQWEKQEGICPFTGIDLDISEYKKINVDLKTSASIDRIDSNQGYIKDNIQWVSRAINLMKNNMSDEETWEMCRLIAENYHKKTS